MKKLMIIGILFIGILFAGSFGFAQDFQTSDLEGTWYMYMFETDPVAGSSYHAHGTFTVDASGTITEGTYMPPDAPAINVAGGTVSLDNDGILSGAIDAEGGIQVTFASGKLGADKNTIAYVTNVSTGAMDFGVAIKDGGSFSTSDLEGTWYMYMLETDPAAGSSYHAHGSFTVDESGNITEGTYIPPGAPAINVAGGTVSLDNDGILSGAIDAEGGIQVTFASGKLGTDKNTIAYVTNATTGAMDFGVAIKGGGSFSTRDLEGTWYMYMLETDPVAGSSYHAHGTFTVDASGTITAGTYIPPDAPAINVTSGTVSLDNDGILSGTIDAEGGIQITFESGKLGADKNTIAYVTNVTTGAMDFGVAVKESPPQPSNNKTGGSGGGGGGGGCFISTMNK